MEKTFNCPICNNSSWEQIGKMAYNSKDHREGTIIFNDRYTLLRRKILFNIWIPGSDSIDFQSQYCSSCYFACYSPRPNSIDIRKKYEFLQDKEIYIGAPKSQSKKTIYLENKRSKKYFHLLKRYGFSKSNTILDVGGGDGRHLLPFYKKEFKCYVIDYNKYPINGITRLGSTLNHIPHRLKFNYILCTHVLEHVAEPVKFLKKMIGNLKDDGLCYVEVPSEIWYDIKWDPVTHINFFTKASLANTIVHSGFDLITIKKAIGSYGNKRILIIWALIRKSARKSQKLISGKEEIRKLITPNYFSILKRRFYEMRTNNSLKPMFRLIKQILRKIKNTF